MVFTLVVAFAIITPFLIVPAIYAAVGRSLKHRSQRFGLEAITQKKRMVVLLAVCFVASFAYTAWIPTQEYRVWTELNNYNDLMRGGEKGLTHTERNFVGFSGDRFVTDLGKNNLESRKRESDFSSQNRTVELESYDLFVPRDNYPSRWANMVVFLPLFAFLFIAIWQNDGGIRSVIAKRQSSRNRAACQLGGIVATVDGAIALGLAAVTSLLLAGEGHMTGHVFILGLVGVVLLYQGLRAKSQISSRRFDIIASIVFAQLILSFWSVSPSGVSFSGGTLFYLLTLLVTARAYHAAVQIEKDPPSSFFLGMIGRAYRRVSNLTSNLNSLSRETSSKNVSQNEQERGPVEQLERLNELLESEKITKEEYEKMKKRIFEKD